MEIWFSRTFQGKESKFNKSINRIEYHVHYFMSETKSCRDLTLTVAYIWIILDFFCYDTSISDNYCFAAVHCVVIILDFVFVVSITHSFKETPKIKSIQMGRNEVFFSLFFFI